MRYIYALRRLTQCARKIIETRSTGMQRLSSTSYPPPSSLSENSGDRRDGMRCLLVRHVPSWLSREEKESLFSHFGAQEVVVMPSKGKLRDCLFAAFVSHEEAKRALGKLHQLDIFGSRLVVEYAKPTHAADLHKAKLDKWSSNTCKEELDDKAAQEMIDVKPALPSEATPKPAPVPTPAHCYLYPHPTPVTIANIANAIVCVPQLYVQVLHIMNKMNLPPPFGPPTPTPPLLLEPVAAAPVERAPCSSSDEGSEIESDEDTRRRKVETSKLHTVASPKRLKVSYKPKVSGLPPAKKRKREHSLEDELQPIVTQQVKKIQLHMPTELTPSQPASEREGVVTVSYLREKEQQHKDPPVSIEATQTVSNQTQLWVAAEGSGDVPVDDTASTMAEEEGVEQQQEGAGSEQFISLAELLANRMSETDMREEHIFKNYSPGEPSVRLYLKNLAKQVEEKDLRYIYGRYINWSVEAEINMFDVRLMKSGRMKGQAFVGLPSEMVASQALKETNGYLLHDRPIVVHFARSSRPKEKGQ